MQTPKWLVTVQNSAGVLFERADIATFSDALELATSINKIDAFPEDRANNDSGFEITISHMPLLGDDR